MTESGERHKEDNESAGLTGDEEIIELTDEIKTDLPNDDEVIELVDEVVTTVSPGPLDGTGGAAEEQPAISPAPEISARTGATGAFQAESAVFADGEIRIGDDIDEEMDFDEGEQDDFVNSLGMDLETDSAISRLPEENEPDPAAATPVAGAVSSDQIEAAVERVIMKILPEKIDNILSAAIERILTREIEKIKGMLLDDSSGERL